jgi:ABC-type transport system substrate-binding protein
MSAPRTTRMAAAAVGAAVAAALLALTACGSGNNSGTASTTASVAGSSPTTSGTGSSSPGQTPTAVQGQYDQQAAQILDSMVRGDFDGAAAHFDSQLKQEMSPDALASAWASYQQQFGAYQSHGDPQDVSRGDLTVVNIPLQMATMPGQFRVTFHNTDGTVAGLYLLKSGAPVP